MKRFVRLVHQYPKESIVTILFYPLICWALYQDRKDVMPWWTIVLVCTLGWLLGIVMIRKVVNPLTQYIDTKITRLFGIKKV